MADPVLPADPIEQHLAHAFAEPAGEHLAVVGQDRLWHAIGAKGQGQRVARRAGGRSSDDERGDAKARVVIDARHDLRLGAVGQANAADDVHLPQLHRPAAFPALVVAAFAFARLGRDQPMANEAAIDRCASRQRHDPLPTETVLDRPRSPTRMLPAHLHDARLDLRAHLMRAGVRLRAPIDEPGQPVVRVLDEPFVHRLATHPVPPRHVGHRGAVLQHVLNRGKALFHKTQLHEHRRPPSQT